ncbi:MAG: adenine deaminase [Bacteroidales bacterium]|nr:adenine deaminase [Deltaproteobacteria bacterium]MBL7137576.1 adenine deaminase [Bacteroidales bacterium]
MKTRTFELEGNIVDVVGRRIFPGKVSVADGWITGISEEKVNENHYILPGLVDAHIHVESSMLIPSEFARLAVVHGTVATVSDPHEIANVLGIPGVMFMIGNGKKVPFKFNFGASSCVPATSFETAGASLGVDELSALLAMDEIRYLSEMMNFPGVLAGDPVVMAKLKAAMRAGKPIDGHAPGLRGEEAKKYIEAGISTDHECFTKPEALDKLRCGMKILIREGSAAKNFEALCSLIDEYPEMVMLCSDDKHPNDLAVGHINELVIRALKKGSDFMQVIRSCTYHPVTHYRIPVGLLQTGDPADLIVVDNLERFQVEATYVDGFKVAEHGKTLIHSVEESPSNNFSTNPAQAEELRVPVARGDIRVQKAIDGQLITEEIHVSPLITNGFVVSDPERDILKLVVRNRYHTAPPAVGFACGFGLKRGAIASCVAHDSHNIVAVGPDDDSIARAINLIVSHKGGISIVEGAHEMVIPLPFAGIMSDQDGYSIAQLYEQMDQWAKRLGSDLRAPYMTLSFMALLVIPDLKLSDEGLFDGRKFAFTSLFC